MMERTKGSERLIEINIQLLGVFNELGLKMLDYSKKYDLPLPDDFYYLLMEAQRIFDDYHHLRNNSKASDEGLHDAGDDEDFTEPKNTTFIYHYSPTDRHLIP